MDGIETEGNKLPAAWMDQPRGEGGNDGFMEFCDTRSRGEGGRGCRKIPHGIAAARWRQGDTVGSDKRTENRLDPWILILPINTYEEQATLAKGHVCLLHIINIVWTMTTASDRTSENSARIYLSRIYACRQESNLRQFFCRHARHSTAPRASHMRAWMF